MARIVASGNISKVVFPIVQIDYCLVVVCYYDVLVVLQGSMSPIDCNLFQSILIFCS